jgi:hypothetical protein
MNRSPIRGLAVLGAALLIVVALAACGGSSSPSSTTAAADTQSTSSSGTAGAGSTGASGAAARRAALTTCLKKYGVALPTGSAFGGRFGATGASGRLRFGATGASGRFRFGATGASGRFRFGGTGASGPRGGGFFGGGRFASNPKFATAIAKCGALAGGLGAGGAGRRTGAFDASSTQDRAEVVSFAACMKRNGVDLPKPNFSGSGSVFGIKVNQTTTAYRSAYAKCGGLLKFLAAPSAPGAGGPLGA